MHFQSYGPNWVLFKVIEEGSESERELLECAQRVWPIACTSGRKQINTETSISEKDRLIIEAWEYVLFAIAKAQKRGCLRSNGGFDLDAYLMKAFQHRLGRLMKIERMHQRLFTSADPQTLETLAADRNNAEADLHRRLQVQEVVAKMDRWTREVWSYLRGGLSWQYIANKFGMSQPQAKMRYRYYLSKIRLSMEREEKRRGVFGKRGRSVA